MPISFDGKKGEFSSCVAHYMGKVSKRTGKKHTRESASKVCGSLQASQEKEIRILYSEQKLQFKEKEEELYSEGFIATTHQDREGDILSENAIYKIAEQINNQFKPQASAASNRHDWLKQENSNLPLAGKAVSAEVKKTEDNELGVYVETHHHKFHPEFEEIKYNIEQGYYPGYSIEFETISDRETPNGRIIDDLDLAGYGFANLRMIANPNAQITSMGYKELINFKGKIEKLKKIKEEISMKKEIKEEKPEDKPEDVPEDKPTETPEEKPVDEKPAEAKEVSEKESLLKKSGEKEVKVSEKDYVLLKKFKEEEEKTAKMKEITESKEFKEMLKAEVKEIQAKNSPLFNPEDKKMEFKELDDYRTALAEIKELDKPMKNTGERQSRFQRTIDKQYKEAGKLCDALMAKGVDVHTNFRNMTPVYPLGELKEGMSHPYEMETYGNRIQMKELNRIEMKAGEGAQVDTNIVTGWTYGNYYLSPVELNDIFQPVLVNQLNDQTTTFGRLKKEDWSGRSSIQFRARTGTNSTVGGYAEGANLTYGTDFTGTVGRQKFQQPFCYYRVLVAVTGQAQRFAMAPGGMGDRWADEIQWSGQDLLSRDGTSGTAATGLNRAILGSGAGTSESIALGFEGLILGTTGTLYGKALASFATLRSHTETLSTENISLEQLRKMIRRVIIGTGTGSSQIHSNSRAADLVFFTHHLQIDFVKAIFQDLQKIVPTSGRVGFEGELEIDGIPIVGDRMITNTHVFLINTANTKIAMNLPPTIEPLPVTADAQAAHIKTYWNLYSDAPGNNYFCDGLATS